MRVRLEVVDVKPEQLAEVCDTLGHCEVDSSSQLVFRVRLPQPVDVHHASIVMAELERRLPRLFTDTTTTEGGS